MKIRGSRRALLSGSGPGRWLALGTRPLRPSRVVGSRVPFLGQPETCRPSDRRATQRVRLSDPARPRGPRQGGLAACRPLLPQPPPPGLPLLPRPRLLGPAPPACPPVSARPSFRPPALPALLRPGPAIPAAHVASSIPAAASPFPAPGPAAAATRGRGLGSA